MHSASGLYVTLSSSVRSGRAFYFPIFLAIQGIYLSTRLLLQYLHYRSCSYACKGI
nr:MAG TPA: hypothetical protein [Caudoviricetes sp.]